MRAAWCACLALLPWAPVAASGQAGASGAPVVLDASGCDELSAGAVRELVALELAPDSVTLARPDVPAPSAATEARLECDDERATLEVRDAPIAEPLRLELDLTRTPAAARTRLVALTLSELIVTSRMEGASAAPQPEVRERAPTEDDAVATAATPASLWLAGAAVHQGTPGGFAFGPQLGLLADLGPLALLVSAQADWRATRAAGADVTARTLSLMLAPGLVLPIGSERVFVGAGMQLGHARLEATAAGPGVEGRALSGLWHAPALTLAVQLSLADPLALHLATDFAYVTRPVRGLDRRQLPTTDLYAHEGGRFGIALGLALRL